MISAKWIAVTVQWLLVLLATQTQLFKADYLIRTKMPLKQISVLLTPAFAVRRGSGWENFEGFIPELLLEMKERGGVQAYELLPASGNEIGRKQPDGNWTGLIQDVFSTMADIGAGPILDTHEYLSAVLLSKPWATVGLTIVVKKSANVTSLKEAIDKLDTFYVVNDSEEAKKLRKVSDQQGSSDITTLERRAKDIQSVYAGLAAVSKEAKSALVLNSEEARYHVTHDHCDLLAIPDFQTLGNYTFAFPRNSLLLDNFNRVIQDMKQDGSLEKLKDKTLGILGFCSSAIFLYPGNAVTFLLAAAVSHILF